jgi:predicted  nucleic acid-binding Zn-ribbon protein
MNNAEPTIKDIFEVVEFIRDNAVTKADLQAVRTELKSDLQSVRTELKHDIKNLENTMIEHVDGFIALYQKHEVELAAVVSRQNRFEKKLDAVIQHLGLEIAS